MSKGQLVGYIRVSTEAQNTARQEFFFQVIVQQIDDAIICDVMTANDAIQIR